MTESPLETLRRLDFYSADALDHLALERLRQIEDENWTPAHDDEHGYGQMANAAACYALSAADNDELFSSVGRAPMHAKANFGWIRGRTLFWPWEQSWWKPKNPRVDLIRAGALVVAELARRARAAETSSLAKEDRT